jgi:glycosyltransferase involved in cell wall biosynthesis
MKVGIVTHFSFSSSDSLNSVFGTATEALGRGHELVYFPPDFAHASRPRQRRMLEEFLRASDVVLGPADDALLQARAEAALRVPYVCFLLGSPSRGAQGLIQSHKLLRTDDLLVGNCTADLNITRKFFPNAQARLVPFAFDDQTFYPLGDDERAALRERLGFRPEERVLLYAGRITLEKNVHTVVRVFSALRDVLPQSRLVVAGAEFNQPFPEFGVFSLGIRHTLLRTAEKLGLPPGSVDFVGPRGAEELRGLYNAADACVNMTLHHDENFGLSQIEAMACGTPVVGTNWGGLKDTIVEGETGHKVGAVVTDSGVKVNWWEAVNRLAALLREGPEARRRLRQRCRAAVEDRYSRARYGEALEKLLAECAGLPPGEPLRSSPFARQYWALCALQWGEPPPYRRGPRAYELYRELITPFAGATQKGPPGGRAEPSHVLCLATPATCDEGGTVRTNDPIFPFELTPPEAHREAVRSVLRAMSEEPVTTAGKLLRAPRPEGADYPAALAWMLKAGLILQSQPDFGGLAPQGVGTQMGRPVFSIQSVPHTTDAVVVG